MYAEAEASPLMACNGLGASVWWRGEPALLFLQLELQMRKRREQPQYLPDKLPNLRTQQNLNTGNHPSGTGKGAGLVPSNRQQRTLSGRDAAQVRGFPLRGYRPLPPAQASADRKTPLLLLAAKCL